MTLNVIKVKNDDLSVVNSIMDNFIENIDEKPSVNHSRTFLSDDRTYLLAATWGSNVIGYALAYKYPSLYSSDYLAYLYDIEVLETHRRKGAGRLLIKTLLTLLKSDGVNELWLGTATDNTEGQGLFSSTGGIKSGETFNDYTYKL